MQLKTRLRTPAYLTLGCAALTLGLPQASCGPQKRDRSHLRFNSQLPGQFCLVGPSTGLNQRTSLSLSNALQPRPSLGVPAREESGLQGNQ